MTKRNAIAPSSLPELLRGATPAVITDGAQLTLVTTGQPKRAGSWVLAYKSPVSQKRTKITVGNCWLDGNGNLQGDGVKEARIAADEARTLINAGQDPVIVRDAGKAAAAKVHAKRMAAEAAQRAFDAENKKRVALGEKPLAIPDSFRDLAERCIEKMSAKYKGNTLAAWKNTLGKYAYPVFGDKHIDEVTKADIAAMQDRLAIEVKRDPRCRSGHHALKNARRYCAHVFNWAAHPSQGELRQKANPVFADPTLYLDCPKTKSRAAIYDEEGIRELVLAVRAHVPPQSEWDVHGGRYSTPTVVEATRFALLVGQRPENIAECRKAHVDLDAGIWVVPAIEMKGRRALVEDPDAKPHIVYLSTQAVAILRAQAALHPASEYFFPGQFAAAGSHMDRNSINSRLGRLGFKGKQTAHGLRGMMRTAGADYAGLKEAVLETILNHKGAKEGIAASEEMQAFMEKVLHGGMKQTYRKKFLLEDEARKVMQGWADWLDQLARPRLALVA